MATASGTPEAREPFTTRTTVRHVDYDKYIDKQLRRTRRQVRTVDLSSAILILVAGVLGYLLLATLVDHWLVSGGLGYAGRTLAWAICLTAAVTWTGYILLPLVFRRINPVYAAHAIEESRPTLKNSLVNFLLLRERGEKMSPGVMAAIEQQAATRLSQVTIEHAVDRSKLVILAWVLLGIVAICAIYKVASPKDPLRSFERMIAPWADIPSPTRVDISSVDPGSTKAFREHFVKVSAAVSGLRSGEEVTLRYSTADGQMIDQVVPMNGDGFTFSAELPPSAGGLQQDLEYWVTAGDATSRRLHIRMLQTPSIVIDRVTYEYPAYTEMTRKTVEHQGDLAGIEGTKVTIEASANDTISSAFIDFECDGTRDLPMQVHDRQASITIPLQLSKGTSESEHASYQLRFVNADGEENPKPIRYKIEVTPDLAPDIRFTEPEVTQSSEITLAPGEVLKMAVSAVDPDFKLASVTLVAERMGQKVEHPLLPAPQAGQFSASFLFDTKKVKLSPGDTVMYWAEAVDNKQPEPNRVETPHYALRIAALKPEQPPQAREGEKSGQSSASQQNPDNRRPPEGDQTDPNREKHDDPADKDDQRQRENRRGKPEDQTPRDPRNQRAGDNAAAEKRPDERQPQDQRRPGEQRDENHRDATEQDKQPAPQKNKGTDEQSRQQGKRPPEAPEDRRVDPDADPGGALQKVLNRMREEQQKQEKKPDQDVPRADDRNQQNGRNQKPDAQNDKQPQKNRTSVSRIKNKTTKRKTHPKISNRTSSREIRTNSIKVRRGSARQPGSAEPAARGRAAGRSAAARAGGEPEKARQGAGSNAGQSGSEKPRSKRTAGSKRRTTGGPARRRTG